MKKYFIQISLLIILGMACSTSSSLESFFAFPNQVWQRFENPILDVSIEHPGNFYNLWLELNYTASFDVAQFPITVIMYTPSGEIRSRDLLLEPDKAGEKIDGLGKLRVPLRKDFAFVEKGVCKFEIENRSQKVETSGLISIGVVLEKAQ